MTKRLAFLATVASGAVGISLLAADAAGAQSPSPSATPAAPSAAALAVASTMRAFDPALTDADLTAIARGIDANRAAAAQLNPKKKRLRNGDEPAVRFNVPADEA